MTNVDAHKVCIMLAKDEKTYEEIAYECDVSKERVRNIAMGKTHTDVSKLYKIPGLENKKKYERIRNSKYRIVRRVCENLGVVFDGSGIDMNHLEEHLFDIEEALRSKYKEIIINLKSGILPTDKELALLDLFERIARQEDLRWNIMCKLNCIYKDMERMGK